MKKISFFFVLGFMVWVYITTSPGNHPDLNWSEIPTLSIHDIRANIDVYNGQPVFVKGTVTYTFYLNAANGGFYSITDKNGNRMPITCQNRVTPPLGVEITVMVVPKILCRFNGSLGVVAPELRRLP